MKLSARKVVVAIAALVIAGVGARVAYGAWSATGTGGGGGRALTAQTLTVTAFTSIGSAGESLYPGGPAGWVYFSVKNPNPYAVTLTGYAWGTPASSDTTNCPNSNFALDANAPTTSNISIPANANGSAVYQVNGVVDMAQSAPNGCQGVGVTVPLTVTGVQQ